MILSGFITEISNDDKQKTWKIFLKAGIAFMIAMAIMIILIGMTGCGIMPVIGVIQFDGAVFDSARNDDENIADKN